MANIIIRDNKGKHIQTWGISDKDIQIYFEMIMSRFDWESKGKKNYLKIMDEKSISNTINSFRKTTRRLRGKHDKQ